MSQLQKSKISTLIVDDEPDLLDQAEYYLTEEKEQIKIEKATSVDEALEMLEEKDFHVIVSDFQMGEKNGLDLLKIVRNQRNDMPFIIFTGRGREEVAIEALNLGADRYLQKGRDPKSQYGVLADAIVQEVENWRSEKRFEALFETTSELIAQINEEDGRILNANPAMGESFGKSKNEIVGKTLSDVLPEDVAEKRLEIGRKAIRDNQPQVFEDEVEGKTFQNIFSPVDVPGEEHTFQIFSRDITQRKSMESEVRRSEEKFKRLFEANPDPVYLINEKGEFLEVNDAFCQITGYGREETIGTNFNEAPFLPEKSQKKAARNFRKRKEGKKIPPYAIEVQAKNGESVYVEINTNLLKEDDKIIGLVGIARDITERKKAEKELRKSEKKYRTTIENANIGVVVYGPEREVKILNPKMEKITGYSKKELPSLKEWFEKLYPNKEKREKIRKKWFGIISKKGQVSEGEAVITTKQGKRKTLLFNGVKLETGDVISFAQDITERKRTEEKFKQLFESAPDGAFLIDKEGVFQEVSDVFCQKVGYDREDIIGKSFLEPIDFLPEESRKKAIENMVRRIEEGEIPPYTIEVEPKDKEKIFVEINANPLESDGEMIGEIVIARDITERKKAQERQEFLHTLLRHDLKNKNMTVSGFLDLLSDTDLSEEQKELLDKAMSANRKGEDLIENVGTLRKIEKEEGIQKVQINSILTEEVEEYKNLAENKGIEIEYEKHKCEVMGGPLLERLFSNLIENSIQHSNCTKIKIYVKEQKENCIITVKDDGCGIPDETKKKIFERGFKSGKNAGSGLGMFIAKRIVKNYGGKIEVKDTDQGGTKFNVYLVKA